MPLTIDSIELEFHDNGRFHDDLILHVGQETWVCDSYYLLIDPNVPGDENASKVTVALKRLLEQWRDVVRALPEGGVCFLPYDFSDEYTAWLRCEARGHELLVQRVWADVAGYSIWPSQIGGFLNELPRVHAEGTIYEISRDVFLHSLNQ